MKKSLIPLFALVVASVTSLSSAQTARSEPVNIQAKVSMCIGCHGIPGYQSSFPEVHRVPMISGQSAGYIAAALTAYQKGDRRHPTMRGVAESLTEQDIAEISAFYSSAPVQKTLKPMPEPPAQVAQLLQKGACISCHGDNFAKPIDPSYPNVAGQYADYLYIALKSYKNRPNAQVGRTNPVMVGIASQFTNAELRLLADYLGSLDTQLQVVSQSRFR